MCSFQWKSAVNLRMPRKGAEVEAWRLLLEKVDSDPSGWSASVKGLFRSMDTDASGKVDVEELGRCLKKVGVRLNEDQVLSFHEDIDENGDGRVSIQEFMDAVEKRKPRSGKGAGSSKEGAWRSILQAVEKDESWERSLATLFKAFDKDGSGSIDVAELASGLVSLGVSLSPDQVMAIREDLDSNGDGTISKSEFEAAVKSKSKSSPPKRLSSSSGSGLLDKAWGAIVAVVQRNPDKWESAVESLFLKIDSDSSGEVDLTELVKGLKGLGVQLTDQQRAALMQDMDSDFNGRISLKEVIDHEILCIATLQNV
jgi:Ca2+-binding EF-hand superfamily protein